MRFFIPLAFLLQVYIFQVGASPVPESGPVASQPWKDYHKPIVLLWDENVGPIDSDVQQNGLGDCWLLATLASIVDSPGGQDLIKTIIKNNKDETKADILLYNSAGQNKKTYTVTKPSLADAQNGFFSGSGGLSISGGTGMTQAHSWVACMEKAMMEAGYDFKKGVWPLVAMEIIFGGDNGKYLWLNSTNDDDLWTQVLAATKVPTVATSYTNPIKGIVGPHAYSVLGSTTGDKTGQIILRNPWGQIDTNSWGIPDNPGNFPSLGNGKFSISLADFRAGFSRVDLK